MLGHYNKANAYNRPTGYRASDCIIKNDEYDDEFLYASKEIDYSYLTKKGHLINRHKLNSNEINLRYMESPEQARWLFLPSNENFKSTNVPNENTTFYILNEYFKEIICASNHHLEMSKKRRKIHLLDVDDVSNQDGCLWKLEEDKQQYYSFYIRNIKYNEYLYAAGGLYKSTKTNRRNVFTWYKTPDSKQFIWTVFCFSKHPKLMPFL